MTACELRSRALAEIVLHIGVGKTGSSSVQHHLTLNGSDRIAGTDFVYCSLDRDGNVVTGQALRDEAVKTGLGYLSSFSPIPDNDDAVRNLRAGIRAIHRRGLTPVFSQEDWSLRFHVCGRALSALGMKYRVIMYVRPQVEFFNAGWWQWWSHDPRFKTPADVIAAWNYGIFQWFAVSEAWRKIQGVETVDIRLHGSDTVNDFLALLGSPPVPSERKNESLGLLALKLYKAVPGLRGVHDGQIDARLAPLLNDGRKAPWAISPELCASVIQATLKGNRKLADILPAEHKAAMLKDARWWDADAFADKHPMTETDLRMTGKDAIEIVRRLLPVLRGER